MTPNSTPAPADERPSPRRRGAAIRAVPVRHPWRWVLAAILTVLLAMLVHTLVFSQTEQPGQTGSRFGWDIVGEYLFSSQILQGVRVTIELTVISMVVGVVIGVIVAVLRMSQSRLLSSVAWAYVWFFRGTPV
ncbi:MAG: ABC transporter permease subunit, partial [Acidimicrobiia bacterium]|nr:ABC transporter permease subunit [Acidimicrobiia bacterium]